MSVDTAVLVASTAGDRNIAASDRRATSVTRADSLSRDLVVIRSLPDFRSH